MEQVDVLFINFLEKVVALSKHFERTLMVILRKFRSIIEI